MTSTVFTDLMPACRPKLASPALRKAGSDQLAVGPADQRDRVAVLDAKEQTGLHLVDDHDAARAAQDLGRDGRFEIPLHLLQDGLAGIEALNEHLALGHVIRGQQPGGGQGETEKDGEKLLHG